MACAFAQERMSVKEHAKFSEQCKICKSDLLEVFAHTAKCQNCGVLLYYPYPDTDEDLIKSGSGKSWPQQEALKWYMESSFFNHLNFTEMTRFTIDESFKNIDLDVLDFGGGGGQFALVCKSHFPKSRIYITDISDESLLDQWRPYNIQILHRDFSGDEQKFDIIFMNDVFEHVSDPIGTLIQLKKKLKAGGKIFIDTPKQFWIYPLTKFFSKPLYKKILNGTVSKLHLQIWSKKSFDFVIYQSGMELTKYEECSEYTMPAAFYMHNMGIKKPIIIYLGKVFYKLSKFLAKNKIICVISEI